MGWKLNWLSDPAPSLEGGFGAWTHLERRVDEETVQVDFLRTLEGEEVVLKRYFFPSAEHRWRGALRHTLLGKPKVIREGGALDRMQQGGLPVARPMAWAVHRDAVGFVHDSWLLTERLPGEDLARRLARGEQLPDAAWFAIGASVGLLHDGGVQHRGLAARNVVVAEGDASQPTPLAQLLGGSGWTAAWVDPAKSNFLPRMGEYYRAAELLNFWAGLPKVTAWARAAFAEGYGDPLVAEEDRLWMRIPMDQRTEVSRAVKKEARRLR